MIYADDDIRRVSQDRCKWLVGMSFIKPRSDESLDMSLAFASRPSTRVDLVVTFDNHRGGGGGSGHQVTTHAANQGVSC